MNGMAWSIALALVWLLAPSNWPGAPECWHERILGALGIVAVGVALSIF